MIKKSRNGNKISSTLNITSLMDVLTIILVFLLINYSGMTQSGNIPKFVSLPVIKTETVSNPPDTNKSILNVTIGKIVAEINGERINLLKAEKSKIITDASNLLIKHKKTLPKNKPAIMTFFVDKNVPYELLDILIVSGAYAGITQINFLTLQEKGI